MILLSASDYIASRTAFPKGRGGVIYIFTILAGFFVSSGSCLSYGFHTLLWHKLSKIGGENLRGCFFKRNSKNSIPEAFSPKSEWRYHLFLDRYSQYPSYQ